MSNLDHFKTIFLITIVDRLSGGLITIGKFFDRDFFLLLNIALDATSPILVTTNPGESVTFSTYLL